MSRRGLLGFAAAACVGCCVGPFLVVIGGIGAIGVIGAAVYGAVALAVSASVIAAIVVVRRRSGPPAVPESQPVEFTSTRH